MNRIEAGLLDRVLSNLEVFVEPFTYCLLSMGWRLRLPPAPRVMLHFVLLGEGVLRMPRERPCRLGCHWLAIVPQGVSHALESGIVRQERRIAPPGAGAGPPFPDEVRTERPHATGGPYAEQRSAPRGVGRAEGRLHQSQLFLSCLQEAVRNVSGHVSRIWRGPGWVTGSIPVASTAGANSRVARRAAGFQMLRAGRPWWDGHGALSWMGGRR